jgi:hypothetical protein
MFGCPARYGVMQVYPGPPLPPEQIAKIGGTFIFLPAKAVRLKTIDGASVTEGDLEVMPGEHTVSVRFEWRPSGVTLVSAEQCYITFQAEAGHVYVVGADPSMNKETWRCWIEDVHTKQHTIGDFRVPNGDQLKTCTLWSC